MDIKAIVKYSLAITILYASLVFIGLFFVEVPKEFKIVREGYIYDINVYEFDANGKDFAYTFSLPIRGHIFIYHKAPLWLKKWGFKIEICNVFNNKESSLLKDFYCNLIGWAFIDLNYNDIKWYD